MSKAMEILMEDHKAILSALDLLEKMLAKRTSEAEEIVEFQGFIGFLKEFADKCHHGKEEGMLFPAMIAAGVPDRGGPVGVMMAEHIQGRGYISSMSEALEGEYDRPKLENAARDYIALLRAHIAKEDTILFPMADRVIQDQELEKLRAGFEEHEEKVLGHGRHEELHHMLHEMQEKYT